MPEHMMTEDELERERYACVFCLGGGELADESWDYTDADGEQQSIAYWYDEVPEYVSHEFLHDDALPEPEECRTALLCCLWGPPAIPGWRLVQTYASGGERDCWWCGDGTDNEHNRASCPLCEGGGYVYLGDGHCEVVYESDEGPVPLADLFELCQGDQHKARRLARVLSGDRSSPDFDSAREWARSCYNRPHDDELIMHAADSILETYGVEGWPLADDCTQGVSYCNAGDPYAQTLCLTPDGFTVAAWGDLVEQYPSE